MSPLPPQPLSPLDGRYRETVGALSEFLSEAGLNRARIQVEVDWLLYLTKNEFFGSHPLSPEQKNALQLFAASFGQTEIDELAELERTTQHDVKAIEYLIRRRLINLGRSDIAELIHFACTSEDINNLAYALTIQAAVTEVWLPAYRTVIEKLRSRALSYRDDAMLARTHGQPATPTTMGKELAVYVYRLERIFTQIESAEYLGKFNGATGTFAAHQVADGGLDWLGISKIFVTSLGLSWNPLTTQIESHDWQAELYQRIIHANRILHNLCTDVWAYISLGYFTQIPVAAATGSSTMPHKINPIRFENSEANLELSNALLDSLSQTLVTSRLQRDLTDSTTQRNIGVALGHSLLALTNIAAALERLSLDRELLAIELNENWEILSEAIQTVLRAEITAGRSSITDPYALMKEFTRGKKIGRSELIQFVSTLDIGTAAKERLLSLTPRNYTGLASKLVDFVTD